MSTTNDKIIIPTIGRRVWYRPNGSTLPSHFLQIGGGQPFDAGIAYVWKGGEINISVLDHGGRLHSFTSVPLLQPGEAAPVQGGYCEWMPYQVGQAKAPVETAAAEQMPQPNAGNMYRKRPVVVEAITFEALVQHGRDFLRSNLQALGPGGMPWSFEYKGHAISHENDDCYLIPTKEGTMKMGRGDMLITGVQGEIYPCKIDIFEANYERVTPKPPHGRAEWAKVYIDDATPVKRAPLPELTPAQIEGRGLLSFGIALDLVKHGAKVARLAWNGKGMFVYLVPEASYPVQTAAAASHFGEGSMVPYNAYLAIKTVDGPISTWVPSVGDCLADDWAVVE